MSTAVFRLAPMSTLLTGMTWALLLVPVVLALSGPRGVALAVAAGYAATWLWMRPTAFEITPATLDIVWPLRRRRVPRSDIAGAAIVQACDLRPEFGTLLRVGVGGLWGGFGLAWSSRGRHLGLYVSRHADGFVLVRCTGRSRSLLITPENPERFVAALRAA